MFLRSWGWRGREGKKNADEAAENSEARGGSFRYHCYVYTLGDRVGKFQGGRCKLEGSRCFYGLLYLALRLCIYNTHTIIPGRIAEGKQVYYMYMQKEIKGKT